MYQQFQTHLFLWSSRQVGVRLIGSGQMSGLSILRNADHFHVAATFPSNDFADRILIRPERRAVVSVKIATGAPVRVSL